MSDAARTAPKVIVLSTVVGALDSVAEILRRGFAVEAVIGLHPDVVETDKVSGYEDVAVFAARHGIAHRHVRDYALKDAEDEATIRALEYDLVWVAGWQRLIPEWLIESCPLGAIGSHGSPDGIHGGRGRSPQNWAILLGCDRFDMGLFRITPGVDDGDIVATRSFHYTEADDIATSYHRGALALADMVADVLVAPERLEKGIPQPHGGFYYPQRTPEDGRADWTAASARIAAMCRALTRPYPGLRTAEGGSEIVIWRCMPFDDSVDGAPGTVGPCFYDGDFLVNTGDGRLLIRDWSAADDWRPRPGMVLDSRSFADQLETIVKRHEAKYPDQPIAARIRRAAKG